MLPTGFLTVLSGSDNAGAIVSMSDISALIASNSSSRSDSDIISAVSATSVSAADIPGGSKGSVIAIIVICLLLFAAAMVLMELIRSKYVLAVNRKSVSVKGLPKAFEGVKIALISDLHQMEFGEYNTMLARKIKLEEPDYIFFAGDMGDSNTYSVDAFYDLLEALGDDIPLLIVPGNHDLRLGGGKVHKNVVDEIANSGAVLLNNTCAQIALGNEKIYVYGFCPELEKQESVDIKHWHFESVTAAYIQRKLGACPKDAPVIMLTHDPAPFQIYSRWGASLVLAGHVHGGLVRLPLIGGLFGPNKSMFPKYTAGEYEHDNSKLFVTRGLGSDYFFRFGNQPEVNILTLTGGEAEEKRPLFLTAHEENDLGISEEVRKATREKEQTQEGGSNPFKDLAAWFKRTKKNVGDDLHSLKDLLRERTDDLRDNVNDKRGVEKNRYAKKADKAKQQHTYLSPENRAKENAKRVREGGGRSLENNRTNPNGARRTITPGSAQQQSSHRQQGQTRSQQPGQPQRAAQRPAQPQGGQQRTPQAQQRPQQQNPKQPPQGRVK